MLATSVAGRSRPRARARRARSPRRVRSASRPNSPASRPAGPFGHYRTGPARPRVRGVPLLAAAAWAMLARPAWAVAGRLTAPPRLAVPLAAGALTAWDVFLDPRMVREGYWTWPGGGRYEGVPASNFAGWFVDRAAVFAAYAAHRPDAPGRDATARSPSTPGPGSASRWPTPCCGAGPRRRRGRPRPWARSRCPRSAAATEDRRRRGGRRRAGRGDRARRTPATA